MNHEKPIFMEQSQVPLGWEQVADCGICEYEAAALCERIRAIGRDAAVVIIRERYTVWEVMFRSWPYA